MNYSYKAYLYNFLFTNSPENKIISCSVLSDYVVYLADEIYGKMLMHIPKVCGM